MIRILAILLLISIAVLIVLSFSLDKTELSADEKSQIIGECSGCHKYVHENEDDDEQESFANTSGRECTRCHHDFHRVHANAACIECHADADGLQDADDAHTILQWAGIGITGATVAGLALNFTVARKRLSRRDTDDETQND